MKKYIDRDYTPLKFHDFLRKVSFPLSLVYYSIMIIYNIVTYGRESLNLLFIIDYAFMIAAIVLIIVALRGFSEWKYSAWKCTVGFFIMTLIYNILYLTILTVFNLSGDGETIMEALQSIIISPFILIYYYKRKSLFSEGKEVLLNKIPSIIENEINLNGKDDGVVDCDEVTELPKSFSNFKHMKEEKVEKKTKVRFCKMCGSQIDVETKKCSGCGKQYFKGIKVNKFLCAMLIFCVIIVATIILNIVQFVKWNEVNKEKEKHTKIISEQQIQIADLNKEIKEKNNNLDFYETHVVVVDKNLSKYHRYECDEWDRAHFRIYDIGEVKNFGYSACPECKPEKSPWQRGLEEAAKKHGLGQ